MVALAAGCTAVTQSRMSSAQADLPPPPPPPLAQPSDVPSLPPPPLPPAGAAFQPTPPAVHRTPPPPAPRHVHEPHVEELSPPPPLPAPAPVPRERPLAITWNPIDMLAGRLSGNVELKLSPLGPHHALAVSAGVLLGQLSLASLPQAHSGATPLISQGLGFASTTSIGAGVELGYHYMSADGASARGFFFGPSLLLGATTEATVTRAAGPEVYGGLALDAGYQEILAGGVTLGVGGGLGWIHMADESGIFPRVLLQAGESF